MPKPLEVTVKVGSCRRTKKEYEAYLKEEAAQRAKVEGMKADGKDEADIKKQIEVLNDTLTVLPDSRTRLRRYAEELRDYINENHKDVGTSESTASEVEKAVLEGRQLLRDVDKTLGTSIGDEEPEPAETGGPDVGDF
mmetsp:Transcript_80179/g.144776  ORF Transcript_80179/g.144776 Transcript_80179/m.144776 type:complete len:138 (+) Transcript_80179:105-518(+)